MQKLYYYFMLLVTVVCCGGMLASCSDDDDPAVVGPKAELNLNFVESDAISAKFELLTNEVQKCAYMVKEASDTVTPPQDVIFAKGVFVDSISGKDTITVDYLEPNTNYNIYVVGKGNKDEFIDKTVKVSFSTTDFTEPVTVTETRYEGFSVHVKAPQEVKERKNAVRFTRGVLPLYNMMKMQMGATDADMLLQNGGDERSTTDAITYTFDEEHSFVKDPDTGEEYQIDEPIVPGEPSVFIAGEFAYGESEFGWGEGYYNAMFDREKYEGDMMGGDDGMLLNAGRDTNEDDYWTGYHHREIIFSKMPDLLDGNVKLETPKLSPINATLRFVPDENVSMYCVLICDEALYSGMILPLLDNNEDYLQWFVSSNVAFTQLGAQSFSGITEVTLDNFYDPEGIQPGVKFHVLVTALGDENGSKQNFAHYEIVTPERTKAAPKMEVKAINNPEGPESPYEVWFNIKSVGQEKVASGKFVANYERDMEYMFSHGYDPASLVESKGYEFSAEDIAQINTANGLNVKFTSRAEATTYLVAVGYNDEGLNSETILAKKRSIAVPAQAPVNSPYFEALKGDWTASVVLSRWSYENSEWVADKEPTKFKVTIGNNLEYPETLPEEVYNMYGSMKKEEVDALYSNFKELSKTYATRLKEQNNLLCTGFNIQNKENGELEYKTPYELFTDETYKGYNNEALFYDFGPKWNLHVNADGSVTLPVNTELMDPMSNWKVNRGRRQTFYLVGLGATSYVGFPAEGETKWPEFPVTVSEDMKTITINPMVGKNNDGVVENFYPSAITIQNGQARPAAGCKSASAITLTKGWNGAEAAKSNSRVAKNAKSSVAKAVKSVDGKTFTPATRPMPRTPFVKAPYACKRVTISHRVTPDEFKQGMIKLCNDWMKSLKK